VRGPLRRLVWRLADAQSYEKLQNEIERHLWGAPELTRAFGCKPGQPMTKPAEKVCKLW